MADVLETAMRFRARLLTREARAVREMARIYARLLAPIDAELRTIRQRLAHARREGLDARDLLYREGRLQALERAVRQQLTRFASAAGELALAQQQAAAAAATGEAAALIGAATPPGITLDTIRLPTGAVEALSGITRPGAPLANLLNQIAAQGATAATDALLTGIALGHNPNRTARAVRDALGVPLHRARTIARTETLRAYRDATLDTYRANPEIVTGWTWLAALDRRTCASCIAQHGTDHPLDEQMASHPNCFPAGVVVSGPAPDAATRRWWEGDLVEIHTAGGARLPVTPNHPLLTPDGWVPAHLIDVGGHLIRSRNGQRMHAAIDPDSHQVPALIEDVCDALRRSGAMTTRSVPAAAMDFHGDSFDSDVDVVWADRLLRNRIETPVLEPAREESLSRRDVGLLGLPGGRPGAEGIESVLLAPACSVCGLDVAPVLFRGSVGGHESVGLSDPPPLNARLGQHPRDRYPGDAVSGAELLLALAGEVQADEVVEVRRFPFSGHVYNLQTGENWYSANGIVTHNCRCTQLPIVRPWRELGFPGIPEPPRMQTGPEWFARQPADVQREVLGPTLHRDFRGRRLTLPDLVDRRTHPVWGPETREATIGRARANAATRRAAA